MKADSGNWLYIVLSVVFLIISTIGKNKKKPTVATTPVNDENDNETSPSLPRWPKNIGDLLTEVMDLPKQQEVIIEKPDQKEVVTETPVKPHERYYKEEAQSLEAIEDEASSYETPSDNKKSDNKKKETSLPIIRVERKDEAEKDWVVLDHDFDLRQGIIYAEILNRKYF